MSILPPVSIGLSPTPSEMKYHEEINPDFYVFPGDLLPRELPAFQVVDAQSY
jgi:hypothetical protein